MGELWHNCKVKYYTAVTAWMNLSNLMLREKASLRRLGKPGISLHKVQNQAK